MSSEDKITKQMEGETYVLVWVREKAISKSGGYIDASDYDWGYAVNKGLKEFLQEKTQT